MLFYMGSSNLYSDFVLYLHLYEIKAKTLILRKVQSMFRLITKQRKGVQSCTAYQNNPKVVSNMILEGRLGRLKIGRVMEEKVNSDGVQKRDKPANNHLIPSRLRSNFKSICIIYIPNRCSNLSSIG